MNEMELKNDSKWLFKYVSFNLNSIKVFINNKLWFGEPDIQNDPNEIEFLLYNGQDFKLVDNVNDWTDFQFPLNIEMKNFLETEKKKVHELDESCSEFVKVLKRNTRTNIGICSMSTKHDDILMWSHYADSNKGICIVFNKEKIINDLQTDIKEKISYSNEIPIGTFSLYGKDGILKANKNLFINKYKVWRYESEFRFVRLFDSSKTLSPDRRLLCFNFLKT